MTSEPAYNHIMSTSDGRRPKTFEELWEELKLVPEGYIGEIVNGEVVQTPRPKYPHVLATSTLGMMIGTPFQLGSGGPGGWVILDEPPVRFGDELRVPDLAGWRLERFVEPTEDAAVTVVPDWICEALSPTTARVDRVEKLPLYARHGVRHVWLIDARLCTLEVFRLENGHWALVAAHGAAEKVRVEPFDAIELDLALLWS